MACSNRVTVEVPLFLNYVYFLLTSSVVTNLIIYRTCYITLGYNKSDCSQLGNKDNNVTHHYEKIVQPYADVVLMVKSLLDLLLPTFICLMAGSWSDKHGRKPVLLVTLGGIAFSCALTILYCLFEDLSPWIFLITAIPTMITGNNTTFFAITLSYISDTSTRETRGLRMAFSEVALSIGSLLGSISSSHIFYATNYPSMFAIGLACVSIGIAYTIICVPESIENLRDSRKLIPNTEDEKEKPVKLNLFKEIIQTTIKKRENYNRAVILLTITSIIIYIFLTHADTNTRYIFLRGKLNWTFTKYNLYNSVCMLIWAAATMAGSYILQRKFHIKDSALALIGLISMSSCVILQFLATNDTMIYIAGASKCMGGLVAPMLRANISRLVPSHEVGKIFAMVVGAGALVSAALTPLYTLVYNNTIYINSALYNLLSISLLAITITLVLSVICLEQKSQIYTPAVQIVEEDINGS
ncbi:probable peptidoglycan muropeptide transporter SLC46 isoform X1 [Diabrotica undecimpunctata]|uniref:probable peptidoglycan muropeptide transporter SLC46 isoform X1 n=2 Tax=Diabrotica undecimpunctata TaxID=50387 RepID=UPI003B63E638